MDEALAEIAAQSHQRNGSVSGADHQSAQILKVIRDVHIMIAS
ncbi:hypothetical protein ACVW1C_005983 [Bradyrhizobium sp. USDA 4011]